MIQPGGRPASAMPTNVTPDAAAIRARKNRFTGTRFTTSRKRPSRKQISWVGAWAPFNGRVFEAKCFNHERGRFVEVLWRRTGPISSLASGGVAIAAQRDPFFSSQYVADT